MKWIGNIIDDDKTVVINEASLIAFLDSEEIIKCVDLYDFGRSVYLILEYMNQGSMTNIITNFNQDYSEDFCRYSLYKVTLGLSQMHRYNVLHRDIKSDNILYSDTGDIKIADLGLSCILSQQQQFRLT